MTTLRVVLDQVVAPVPGGTGRYAEELTRHLIDTAPAGCDVAGIVPASSAEDYGRINDLLPGLSGLHKTLLPRNALSVAWQLGLSPLMGKNMVHSPDLLAPLGRHDRLNNVGDQTVVTIHDMVAWTHPETMSPRAVVWNKMMVRRAHRYADAVVVPTHLVGEQLASVLNFGDRIRIIGGAVSSKLALPVDADSRAATLDLPREYLLSVGTLEPRKGLTALIQSLAHPESVDLPLLIVGPEGWGDLNVAAIAAEAGLAEGRVRALGFLADADLAVVLDRATVFVFPSLAEGFGLPVIEAFHFGTPVVHSDAPAVLEVAAGAGVTVARDEPAGYPERLATTIASVVGDAARCRRLRTTGLDRAKAFSWKDSAERVWQLHADL
ncbi:glycosyltransferase family 1 protein [Parafrigoribacterium mesophilum]|uniref:glycosyltransferase family 4 protein n=1 Tax=Parafrigoribacterium mesophilum TaxID=433646 RepID=UPI0031FD0428